MNTYGEENQPIQATLSEFSQSPDSDKILRISVTDVKELGLGTDYLKYRIRATFLGEGSSISFISRRKHKRYFDVWLALKEAGLPVIDTLWISDLPFGDQARRSYDDAYVTTVEPDLTVDGSRFYGKSFVWKYFHYTKHFLHTGYDFSKEQIVENYDFHDGDLLLLSILGKDKEKIKLEMLEYSRRASEKRIVLPSDEKFELRVFPSGKWGIYLLDFEYSLTDSNSDELSDEEISKRNTEFALSSIRLLNLVEREFTRSYDKKKSI